jgi:endonuclease/exonuclease/phosphatase family metal-dependent hydrolase
MGNYMKKTLLILLFTICVHSLKVLQFNIWEGGTHADLNHTLAIIRNSEADIISLSEAAYNTANFYKLKDSTGFYGYLNTNTTYSGGVLSRYPIIDSFKIWNAIYLTIGGTMSRIAIGADTIWFKTCHLYPHDSVVAYTRRRAQTDYLCNWLRNKMDYPVIWTGDFNTRDRSEGLDSTAKVEYLIPAIKDSLYSMKFYDAYRTINPNFSDSGVTFISTRGRLDYIFYNKYIEVTTCTTLTENFYSPWPSDHYAVLATVNIKEYKKYFPTIIKPIADAYVTGASANINFGTNADLTVGGTGPSFSYLKFLTATVNTTKTIDSVALRLKTSTTANADAPYFGNFIKMPTNNWIESGAGSITYNNADKTFLDTICKRTDSVKMVTIYSAPLRTTDVVADTVTFAIISPNANAGIFAAREYTSEPPQLFVYYAPASIDTPLIDSIRPVALKAGTLFTLYGSGFKAAQTTGSLMLNAINLGAAGIWSDTLIVDTIPVGTPRGTYTKTVVTNSDGLSDTISIRVIKPEITVTRP